MNQDSEKLRKYFLGVLPEADVDAIEERIISDPDFESDLFAAENDLVEDHLDGALKADEIRLFADNYLVTTERAANVVFLTSIRQYSKANYREQSVSKPKELDGQSFFDRIRIAFLSAPKIGYAVCLLIIVSTVAAYFWFGRGGQNDQIQSEYAALNRKDFSDLESYRSFTNMIVVPGTLRGSASTVKLTDTSGESIFVRLSLPIEFKDQPNFKIRLLRENKELLSFESKQTYESGGGKEIRLLLPAKRLEKGSYQLNVSPVDKPDSPVSYVFSVE